MINRKGVEITIPGYEGPMYVNYGFYPGRAAAMYDSNGDPGWPAEDSESDILWVSFTKGGADIWEILSDETQNRIQDACTACEEAYKEEED